ncbi:hypothetical protein ACFFV7_51095 [Nonomuraea spiralis]|uniref:Uncharacterized protein n=1 Tax=Nonomuraea spiralis TaxID=46182 RepID=A0ABV5J0U8_9ACTN|nr:hypothetical protein [Nonomuraea spiralis]GGS88293.1 hypothetical protein GCM10010176_035070 [Nonomuraea spiralis]
MIFDWFRSRAALVAELVEAREQCADVATALETSLRETAGAKRERDAGRRTIGDLLARLELGDRATMPAPTPLTPGVEVLRERSRADALAERLALLQEANMRADCMHKLPAWRAVSAR